MKTEKTIALVGGIPQPVGGVTTFIRRLIARDSAITWLFDLYPASQKDLPLTYQGKYIYSTHRLLVLLQLFWFCLFPKTEIIHFNFSSVRALRFLRLLPQRKATWILTLHHGDLGSTPPQWAINLLRKKMMAVVALNDRHYQWYRNFLSNEQIHRASAYVKPRLPNPGEDFRQQVATLKAQYHHLLVCSGYPTALYNHLLAIELMHRRVDDVLVCCLYGRGEELEAIVNKAQQMNNVVVLQSLAEDDFNFLLSESDLYLRLNREDSFGIATADAVNFGVTTLATNVCPRYPGSLIIDVPQDSAMLLPLIEQALTTNQSLNKSCASINEFDYRLLAEYT